jgi:DNA-binding HxlR family transcriptional regulator
MMAGDRHPDRVLPGSTGQPVGETFPVEGDLAVEGNLVPCIMQVTKLQYFLYLSIPFVGSKCVAIHDLRQWNDRMKFARSECPITNVLDLLGDKWTLLVIRDLVLGKRRYQEFMSSPERIASNILADRLKKLEAAGLVTRRTYQGNPPRYEYRLTKRGKGLEPVLEAIIVWGQNLYPDTKRFPRVEHR